MGDIVAIIPARSGSKGMPDKNIKLLAGRPLIAYSIAAAKRAFNIDRVIVSTDSEYYGEISREYGAEVPFLRPAELSDDHSTDYEFIKHALDWFQENEVRIPQYLVHIRPTTPLREVHHIEAAIDAIKKDPEATALRSVHEMSESAYKTFEVENGCLKSVGSGSFDLDAANAPRQEYPKTYVGNGYVDVVMSAYVLKNQRLHGDRVFAYITPFVAEVDTEEDFQYLEYQVKQNLSIAKTLFG
jgi:CMP-N,N'-diacetyllegionaminic acid synthase